MGALDCAIRVAYSICPQIGPQENVSSQVILLDTHVLLWFFEEPRKLGRRTLRVVEKSVARSEAAWSAISVFETALLLGRGRLRSVGDVALIRSSFSSAGGREYPVDGEIAVRAAEIGLLDPFDRIITATAQINNLLLVTADKQILDWPGHVKRLDART
jgi:PIN domain nuclease of toxin-antitoxin system